MGSKKGWPRELADRCNAVGWPAELVSSGHWKAKLPDGSVMTWAESPSDRNAYKNAMRVARTKGLDQLELELRLQREKERLERIQADREQNGVPEHLMEPPQPNLKEEIEMANLGYIEVGGTRIGIAEQGPARYQPSRGGDLRLIEDARELLLVDGSVYFQCLKPTGAFRDGEAEICNRAFPSARSLPTHQSRMHPDLDFTEPEAPAEPKPKPQEVEIVATVVPVGPMARLTLLTDRLRKLEGALEDAATEAGAIANGLEKAVAELPELLLDDETRQKVAILDQMRGLLK